MADNSFKHAGSLIYGTLSEYTKPGILYSKVSVDNISSYLSKKVNKITKSALKTIFAIKLLFVLSNKNTTNCNNELAFNIAEAILNEPWVTKSGASIKSMNELCDAFNLPKLLLLISSLLALNAQSEDYKTYRSRLVKLLAGRLSGDQLQLSLSLLQLLLLK